MHSPDLTQAHIDKLSAKNSSSCWLSGSHCAPCSVILVLPMTVSRLTSNKFSSWWAPAPKSKRF